METWLVLTGLYGVASALSNDTIADHLRFTV